MNQFTISGIQQIGIGVANVHEARNWYAEMFGVGVTMFDEKAVADIMAPYMKGVERERHAILALNLQGGGGFEVWQHLTTPPHPAEFEILPGDLGISACKIKAKNVEKVRTFYLKKGLLPSELYKDACGRDMFFLKDPYGNLFQIVQSNDWFLNQKKPTGGVLGAIIGTDDMEKSISFYCQILGYDTIMSDQTDTFSDLGEQLGRFRRVILTHKHPRRGAFSKLLGSSEIELVQAFDRKDVHKIYEGRMWGDLGFIQICFDIRNMSALAEHCQAVGHPFTIDSRTKEKSFDMGEATGNFAYNEDPVGTLIEYVETERIPLLRKPSIRLNLKKREPEKSLPRWMFKILNWSENKGQYKDWDNL